MHTVSVVLLAVWSTQLGTASAQARAAFCDDDSSKNVSRKGDECRKKDCILLSSAASDTLHHPPLTAVADNTVKRKRGPSAPIQATNNHRVVGWGLCDGVLENCDGLLGIQPRAEAS